MRVNLKILALFWLSFVSFSATAQYLQLTGSANSWDISMGNCSFSVGDTVALSAFDSCIGGTYSINGVVRGTVVRVYHITNKIVFDGTKNSPVNWLYVASVPSCPSGTVLVDDRCVNQCESLAGNTKSTTWDYTQYGSTPTFCTSGCELKTTGSSCFLSSGGCGGTVVITGETCSDEGTSPGGNIPDEVPQGCQDFNGTYLCPKDADGDGQPDSGQPIDTDAKCGYDASDKFKCSGGTYAEPDYEMQDPTKPIEGVESNPLDPADTTVENVEGVSDPTQQSDERAQILLMNKQINALLEALNSDNNANFKKVVDELKNSNEYNKQQLQQIVSSTNKQVEIWNELKALQKTGTEDLVNAINGLDDYDEHYHNQQMGKLNELISAVNGISNGDGDGKGQEILDSISNVDAAIDGTSATYTSQHDDESLKTTMVNRLYETKNKIHDGMLDAFVSIDLSGASRPSFALDMNGFGFGTYDMNDYVNFDYIFGFIRICILFTAAMLCRKLIFGG